MKKLLETEFSVAFHKHSQRVWVRPGKYGLLVVFGYFFWHSAIFWWTLAAFAVSGLLVHGFYRAKTRGWTQSYGQGLFRWDHEKVRIKK